MAITSHGYTGAVNNVQWAGLAGSLGCNYVAKGQNDCKVSSVPSGTRTVRIAAGAIAGGGVIDYNDAPVDISLPSVASGSQWFLIIAKRTWQTTNATAFTYITGTATRQIPPRESVAGTEDDHPLALVRIAAGQSIPAEVIDLRVISANNGVMVGFDQLCLQYLADVGTVVSIGAVEWLFTITGGVPGWVERDKVAGGIVDASTNTQGTFTVDHGLGFAPTRVTGLLVRRPGSGSQAALDTILQFSDVVVWAVTSTQIQFRLRDLRGPSWWASPQPVRIAWTAQ